MVADVTELRKIAHDFEADAKGKVDAKGRPDISKFKWARHRTSIKELRERMSWKRADLANALSVLQTNQG